MVLDHEVLLVDLELAGPINRQTVRLLVHKDPGITLADCESISREVADILDVEDLLPGRYRLEVTSPGLDRPLQSDRDFNRASSRLLKVVMVSGKTVYGRLLEWDSRHLTLQVEAGVENLERQDIAKATIEPEL